MKTLEEKIAVLKRLEADCWRIAVHLLQDEALAAHVVMTVLLELGQDTDFVGKAPAVQLNWMKRLTIRTSIQAKRAELDRRLSPAT